ncbi:AraC family transcriptional regulator [Ereboglobus luteus]|uniref:AraC family transcriptional regulator n=1 Tax=Ereboglobus luteus TaxID=1796921 RepID=A0A2U8E4L3_9BACT|nr:AraC family transcriptional regulator [Ereboglobus luteus]AWI09803.1 AraC family transcriptional regulator [Ereboglobus luteus]
MADPLSDILRLAKVEPTVAGGFTAGGAWSIRFPAPDKLKFFAILKGGCWLAIDNHKTPVRIEEGDVILLSLQTSFILAGDLSAVPLDAVKLFEKSKTQVIGDAEDCVQIGGHIRLDGASGAILEDVLPPFIHIKAASPQAASVKWLLDQYVRERARVLPGGEITAAHLVGLMFVQILRLYVDEGAPLASEWLRAIADKQLAPALRLMHETPGRSWRIDELAKASGMSRTAFAVRFKTVAGIAPLAYLTQWRMRLAEHALREENATLAALAERLGYSSESAFSNAFKRVTGCTPRACRRAHSRRAR